jgi:hypothetical protein
MAHRPDSAHLARSRAAAWARAWHGVPSVVPTTAGNLISQVNSLAILPGRRRIRFPLETVQRQPFFSSRKELLRARIRSNSFPPGLQQNLRESDTQVR